MQLSIVGAGSFGMALAIAAARAGNDVLLWAHDPRVADDLREKRENPIYMPGFKLSEKIQATNRLEDIASFSETIFMVVPSHHYRGVLTELSGFLDRDVKIISATKGIENESLERMSEISAAVLGARLSAFAALSGPTFALELARGDPTAAVIASSDRKSVV